MRCPHHAPAPPHKTEGRARGANSIRRICAPLNLTDEASGPINFFFSNAAPSVSICFLALLCQQRPGEPCLTGCKGAALWNAFFCIFHAGNVWRAATSFKYEFELRNILWLKADFSVRLPYRYFHFKRITFMRAGKQVLTMRLRCEKFSDWKLILSYDLHQNISISNELPVHIRTGQSAVDLVRKIKKLCVQHFIDRSILRAFFAFHKNKFFFSKVSPSHTFTRSARFRAS